MRTGLESHNRRFCSGITLFLESLQIGLGRAKVNQ